MYSFFLLKNMSIYSAVSGFPLEIMFVFNLIQVCASCFNSLSWMFLLMLAFCSIG